MKLRQLAKLLSFAITIFSSLGGFCQTKVPNDKDGLTIISLDLNSKRPIVELRINGKGPYRFIFDTGSSGSVIDASLATELGLEVIGEDSMGTPGFDNVIMSKRVKAPLVTFEGTDISKDATMNTMGLREMLPVDGILSPTFFLNDLITLDYPNSKLILGSGELDKADKDVTPFRQKPRVINLDVFIDGNKLEAHLDSGNPGGFDIPFSLKDQLNFKNEPYEAGVINTPAASFKRWRATLIGDIKIGSVTYKNPEVNLVENFKFVNFGYQILKNLRTTIDRKNSLIKFEKLSSTIANAKKDEYRGEENDFTGWYGGNVRRVLIEHGEMLLQRGSAPKLKLVKNGQDIYDMVFHMPVRNSLPQVRFERDKSHKVTGLTFVYKDGKEEFVKKDR